MLRLPLSLMFRLAFSLGIAVLLGMAAVVVVGRLSDQGSDYPGLPVDCDTSDPECVKQIDAALQAEFPDAKVKEILFENEPIKAMAAGRELGSDYWLNISHVWRPLHGQRVARVNVVFAEPVSYSGEILWASDPCQGHTGEDERLDPDDPCLDEPREYGTRYVIFPNVRDVYATVELGRRDVIEVFTEDTPPDILEDTIRYYKDPIEYRKYYEGKIEGKIGPLLPPTPEPTVATTPPPESSPPPSETPTPSSESRWVVRANDQMRVSVADIRQDAAGKYFVPDRGDGCSYVETWRGILEGTERVVLFDPKCELFFELNLQTGEVLTLIP